jgi:hypothetical protein
MKSQTPAALFGPVDDFRKMSHANDPATSKAALPKLRSRSEFDAIRTHPCPGCGQEADETGDDGCWLWWLLTRRKFTLRMRRAILAEHFAEEGERRRRLRARDYHCA